MGIKKEVIAFVTDFDTKIQLRRFDEKKRELELSGKKFRYINEVRETYPKSNKFVRTQILIEK